MKEIIFAVKSPDGRTLCYEWLAGDGWKNDYYGELVENGCVSDEDVNVELVRKQFTGQRDINGERIFDGDQVLVSSSRAIKRVRWNILESKWVLEEKISIELSMKNIDLSSKNIKKFDISLY